MIALLRLTVFGLIFLTGLYFLLGIYIRSLRREKLEKDWAEEGSKGARDDYVEKGMAEFEPGLKRWLVVAVYVVPITVVLIMLYVTNFM